MLESMHEAFARGVQMGGGGAPREQPKPALSAEEEQAMGTKAPVVFQEEVRHHDIV